MSESTFKQRERIAKRNGKKYCAMCHTFKSLKFFYHPKDSYCIKCRKAYNREYREEMKEEWKIYHKLYSYWYNRAKRNRV